MVALPAGVPDRVAAAVENLGRRQNDWHLGVKHANVTTMFFQIYL
ncbi:hypothetical protein ACQPYE_09065 [Actinosynnema sp. CA-299493]